MSKIPFHGIYEITGQYLQDFGHWTKAKPHTGLDLVGVTSLQIYAPVSGKVLFAGNEGDGFGNFVKILGVDGNRHYLCHMSKVECTTGQQITEDMPIGIMGATGNVTGPHTHYEIRKGTDGNTLISPPGFLGIPNKQGTYTSISIPTQAESQICIDNPLDSIHTGSVIVSGWVLDHVGVVRVDVYIDNNVGIGSVHLAEFTDRVDVQKRKNSNNFYKNGLKSGFSLKIPADKLSSGKHTVKVALIPQKSNAVWATRNFTFKK